MVIGYHCKNVIFSLPKIVLPFLVNIRSELCFTFAADILERLEKIQRHCKIN
jgi:hypothetical protein